MPEKTIKKARRPMTAVRMWKVTDEKVKALGFDQDPNSTVADYLNVLKDQALEEMASK